MKFHRRKFYEREQEGRWTDAIVRYAETPIMGETITLSDEEAREKGYRVEFWQSRYRHYIHIDFYFFTISHYWETSCDRETYLRKHARKDAI